MKKIFSLILIFVFGLVNFFHKHDSKILGRQLTNAVSITTNEFKQKNAIGTLDLTTNPNPSVLYCRYDYTNLATATIIPGTGLILVDLAGNDAIGPPIVDTRTLDADAIEGVLIYDPKKATKDIGDVVAVAQFGAVVFMEASAAISRGAKVALVLATPGQVVTLTTEALLGKALDKAAAAGDIIRVQILAQGVV
jgi:hypothetical protein